MTSFATGLATPEDRDALIALEGTVGAGFARADFDRWAKGHPGGASTIPIIRDESGNIVGAAWIIPLDVWAGGRRLRLASVGNLHVHPAQQGGAAYAVLSRHLGREVRRRFKAHISLVSPETHARLARSHPERVGTVSWWLHVIDPGPWADAWAGQSKHRWLTPVVRAFGSVLCGRDVPPSDRITVKGGVPGDAFDELARATAADREVRACRDAAQVAWRFGVDGRDYRLIEGRSEGKLEGYAVVRIRKEQGQVFGYLMDVTARDGPGRRALVAAAVNVARSAGAVAILAASSSPQLWTALGSQGFARNPFERQERLRGLWPDPLRYAIVVHDPEGLPPHALHAGAWQVDLFHHETL